MILFHTSDLPTLNATLITFEIDGGITDPAEVFSTPLPNIPQNMGVILSGRGPIWLYARLVHHYHPARWIAIHDPRLGYIIVQSHVKEHHEGDILEVNV
ncbi:CRISPR-associated ring nuclease Crn3/Csx3 [Sulfuricurvum sp.]|uniref:CRISPR-associated ring nuclease Crn3/Csx3 n=1 Tax=Sulfuricurvum sp. TaxID=2025608 RepID=UPI002602E263|nr:CRISPR-associated ring nuclease Crn3/Csx3 [Sulfuricurvum sp.]MDD3596354.1 CRISPR-associated ring nuclease Crn3/Csx3 [Sulfuricurvum sp.]